MAARHRPPPFERLSQHGAWTVIERPSGKFDRALWEEYYCQCDRCAKYDWKTRRQLNESMSAKRKACEHCRADLIRSEHGKQTLV
jgi:predicted SprT family Zn-dependent metalloprotease